jgi:predicted regulator of Ras-like GTPase activity (Roadblock/LC7/MglB family)
MFRDSLQKLVERVDGGVAGILMGFDGISVEAYTRPESRPDPRPDPNRGGKPDTSDIQTIGMELAHVIGQVRRAAELLEAGTLDEVTIRAEKLVVLVRALSDEYFLAFALRPQSSFGKARYAMRVLAPKIQAEL